MGALHEGHLSIVRRARAENDAVAATVFVNPTQFGPREDFKSYPRDLARDAALLAAAGCDLLFAPPVEEIYPAGHATGVEVSGVSEPLEGEGRIRNASRAAAFLLPIFIQI
jgi:pantoate--beta-alanine ligase